MPLFSRNKNKKNNSGSASLSEDQLSSVGGGYETYMMEKLGVPVYRGIDSFGYEFYTTDESRAKIEDKSGLTVFPTKFDEEAALKARNAPDGIYYVDQDDKNKKEAKKRKREGNEEAKKEKRR